MIKVKMNACFKTFIWLLLVNLWYQTIRPSVMESELAPIKYLQDSHVYKDYTISVSIIKCEQVNNQPLSRQLIIWVQIWWVTVSRNSLTITCYKDADQTPCFVTDVVPGWDVLLSGRGEPSARNRIWKSCRTTAEKPTNRWKFL